MLSALSRRSGRSLFCLSGITWRGVRHCMIAAVLAVFAAACGGNDDGGPPLAPAPFVAVLGAFPGEMAPVLGHADVEEEVMVEGRRFRLGTLGGARVVIGMTGIGLMNATATTSILLDNFAVEGVIVSAVAGSFRRIGDVVVPVTWEHSDGGMFTPYAPWLELAREITAPGVVTLDRCTEIPSDPEAEPVCMPFEPVIVVGGHGRSADPFGVTPFACRPGGDDVFGCDIPPEDGGARAGTFSAHETAEVPEELAAADMETAAIAGVATDRGLPFIAFRAVSDGAADPLGLPGFPAQFFAYYRLAARNAALAATAFLERLSAGQ